MTNNRDAYFVVRGYKYQFDQTILRWLDLGAEEELQLECGEDIDVMNSSILKREVGQVKYLTKPISLRSSSCKIAVAHAVAHFTDARSETRTFRFITNAAVTSERPSLFDDRKPGIEVWKKIKDGQVAEPDLGIRLQRLLAFLQSLSQPAQGINAETWSVYSSFINRCNSADLGDFVTRFEWSYSEPNAGDIERKILRILQKMAGLKRSQVKDAYARLLLFVIRLASKPGPKILRRCSLDVAIQSDEQSQQDTLLLSFLQGLFALDSRVQSLESQVRRQNDAMEEIREDVVNASFGQIKRVSVSSELAISSTEAPPLVGSFVTRTETAEAVQATINTSDWYALYGSLGSGKTQLAALLATQSKNYVYVSLRELNALEANFFLHHFFIQLASENRPGSVTAAGLASLPAGAVVIIDDLPRFHDGAQLAERLVQIARQVAQREQKLLTLSHHQIPSGVRARLDGATFAESVTPRFTRNETRDLLLLLELPDEEVDDDTLDSLLRHSDGWHESGKVDVPKGLQRAVLLVLADKGGALTKDEAIKSFQATREGMSNTEIMKSVVTPTLTKLRSTIKAAIARVAKVRVKPTEIGDPLPYDEINNAWRSEIVVGFAEQDDMGKRLRFVTKSQQTAELEATNQGYLK